MPITTTLPDRHGLRSSGTFGETDIIILGAGCIGLTAARALLIKGYHVTIVAKHLPGDTDIFYASNWAGASWSGSGRDAANRYILASSYRHLVRLATTEPSSGVCMVRMRCHYEKDPEPEAHEKLWYKTVTSNYRKLEPGTYPSTFEYACEYDQMVIDPPIHLLFLKAQIEALGGVFVRRDVAAMDELYASYPQSTVFINASGLGAGYIKGLEDPKVFPDRGQNVLVSTEDTGMMYYRSGEEYTYIIPRPLSKIQVCGGIHQPHNTTKEPDMAIAADEIRRANRLAPHVISTDPKISSYVVGIRPARTDGYRLERELVTPKSVGPKNILHAYGYGPSGWAHSYGTADELVKMVEGIEFEATAGTSVKAKL